MNTVDLIVEIEKDKQKLEPTQKARFARVVDVVPDKGVKIKIDGEEEAIDTYYNSYILVNVGDKVGIKYVSGTIIIEGKLQY